MKKWFTLVEVTIVVLIMWIILSITIFFGADYMKSLQLRTQKELLLNTINYTLSYVKSTNYYHWGRFSFIDITLFATWASVTLDSWTWFWESATLVDSVLTFSWTTSETIRLFPYVRACTDTANDQDVVSYEMESTKSDEKFCFDRDMRLCKLFVVACP